MNIKQEVKTKEKEKGKYAGQESLHSCYKGVENLALSFLAAEVKRETWPATQLLKKKCILVPQRK